MKIIKFTIICLIYILSLSTVNATELTFNEWLDRFKKESINKGISEKTFDEVMSNVKYLPKVIEYDRYQPEFYEDTFTYISKRSSNKKVKKGKKLYLTNKDFINDIEKKFSVEKELLLALMGIETNFGTYVGKMDILSCLATLSFDKRRSDFFSKELITILKLVENGTIDHEILFGSWAGAFGNFQFMPSTIKNYAIDYNLDNKIELKEIEDSFASAANYISKIGWEKNAPCYLRVKLKENIPIKYLNTSARNIDNKRSLKFFKRYLIDFKHDNIDDNINVGIITPDKDIIPDSKILNPAYLIFENYELILKWNRSLRFALAVCELKSKFENEL